MNDFPTAMRNAGLTPPGKLIADGSIHRFSVDGDRGKNSWYVLYSNPTGGSFGCWKRGISETWSEKVDSALTGAEKVRHRANMEAAMRQRDAEQAEIHEECREASKKLWEAAEPAPAVLPYLIKKQVKSHKLRLHNKALVVPVEGADGTIHGLQFITTESKRFKSGTNKKGHYFPIGDKPETVLYLAEGYATAATIHEVTGEPVAVCFDAGNLTPVAKALRARFPALEIVICADNDRSKENNVGLTKAREAAEAIGGRLAVPEFPENAEGTDFNDLAAVAGVEEVKLQIIKSENCAKAVREVSEVSGWGELLPLHEEIPSQPYPIEALPGLIGEAVREYQRYGQQPLSIVANSALAAVSLACQCLCNVARDDVLRGPISLNFLSVAESGERKTSSDKVFRKKPAAWLKRKDSAFKSTKKKWERDLAIWDLKRKRIEKRIRESKEGEGMKKLEAELDQHYMDQPPEPSRPELFLSDTNQASLMNGLGKNALYGCSLWDDEGGNIVGGDGSKAENATAYCSVLNKMWDGSRVTQDRIGGNRVVEGRRLTVNIMAQEVVVRQFINGNNGLARGSGLLARFLITAPESTIGERLYQPPGEMPALDRFGDVLVELLNADVEVDNDGHLDPMELQLSQDAFKVWVAFHDEIETTLKKFGEFSDVKDVAAKTADNAVRIAANFHVFQFGLSANEISEETMKQGAAVAVFHLTEARRVYGSLEEASPEYLDASLILDWMKRKGFDRVKKTEAMKSGPNSVRKKDRLDPALEVLVEHCIARLEPGDDNFVWIVLNPEYLKEEAKP